MSRSISRPRRAALLALAIILVAVSAPRAQLVQETIVEGAPSACIDEDLAHRARLFEEYPGFLRACLYRAPGGGHVLTIHHRSGGRTLRVDREISAEELRSLRGTLGFALLYRIYADDARAQASRGDVSWTGSEAGRWSLGIEPRIAVDGDVRTHVVVRARF